MSLHSPCSAGTDPCNESYHPCRFAKTPASVAGGRRAKQQDIRRQRRRLAIRIDWLCADHGSGFGRESVDALGRVRRGLRLIKRLTGLWLGIESLVWYAKGAHHRNPGSVLDTFALRGISVLFIHNNSAVCLTKPPDRIADCSCPGESGPCRESCTQLLLLFSDRSRAVLRSSTCLQTDRSWAKFTESDRHFRRFP